LFRSWLRTHGASLAVLSGSDGAGA
jgi:hypothetical protein